MSESAAHDWRTKLRLTGVRFNLIVGGATQLSHETDDDVSFTALRKLLSGAYIANNQHTLSLAEITLGAGDADLFSIGFLSLRVQVRSNVCKTRAPLAEAPWDYWHAGDSTGCPDRLHPAVLFLAGIAL